MPLPANCFCLVGLSLSALPIPCPSICASSCCLAFSACSRDEIDWNEFEPQLAAREATERRSRASALVGAGALFSISYLGDGEGQLGFFEP